MEVPLRHAIRLPSLIFAKSVHAHVNSCNRRYIMTSTARLEKVMQDLKRNPYFTKYAEKIAKLEKSSPEDFLQRVESQERKICEKKVAIHPSKFPCVQSLWTFPFRIPNTQSWWARVERNNFSSHACGNVYVTTPIFYVNGEPHIGHLYSALVADTMARFNSMLGHSVFLSTGTDEHGTKVEKAAKKCHLPNLQYCNQVSQEFQNMCDLHKIRYTKFIRTTEERHREAVQHFWDCLEKRGHIYKGKYSGWYCELDEAFVSNADVTEIRDAEKRSIKVSVESGNPVEWTEEETYMFRLTSFERDLAHWLNTNVVQPSEYHKMLTIWIENGLNDLCISRPISRVPWGIPIPSDESHTVYVWLDALINYLTAVGYPNPMFQTFWPPTIHVVGKDIMKFHGIYWPAFLMAAGLDLPKKLLCHGHWTVDDLKMSKSKGNVISPFKATAQFTMDGLRYFLLRHPVLHSDANYNAEKINRVVNAELANTLGNLLSRCISNRCNATREIYDPIKCEDHLESERVSDAMEALIALPDKAKTCYTNGEFHQLADLVMDTLRLTNKYFTVSEPWLACTNNEIEIMKREAVLSFCFECARVVGLVLQPMIPNLASNLLNALQIENDKRTWDDTKPLYLSKAAMGERHYESTDKLFHKLAF